MTLKIKQLLKNRTGAAAIEQTIILMIFVILFCFVNDIILVSYRQFAISEMSNKVSRMLAVQGGAMAKKPAGYQDESGRTYKNQKQISKSIENYLSGLESNLTHVFVTNETTGKTADLLAGETIKVNYKEKLHLRIEYTYSWDLTQNVIPTLKQQQGVVERYTIGEFNYG